MRQGLSWVEWTGFALVAIAVALFLSLNWLAPLLETGPPAAFISGAGIAAAQLGFLAFLIAGIGLSLFLVRPLLLLGPRAPAWLIPFIGLALFALQDRVCRAIYSEDLDALASRADCQIYAPGLGLILIFFGVVLTVRQFQVFRKRAG
jgi:hypothetical protein